MKNKSLKAKIVAVSLSVITACSVGMMAITPVSATVDDDLVTASKVIWNTEYQCGMGLLRQYVPGGQAIAGVIDSLVGAITGKDSGPTLSDISKDLNDFREDVSRQFDQVKEELKNIQKQIISIGKEIEKDIEQQTRRIEQQFINQTVLANKGSTFDGLMTMLRETDRQISAITNDDTLTEQEKAVEIAMLIGRNDKWNSTNNLYFNYMSFLDALTSATFCATGDHDIFYYIYQSNIPYAAFSHDAKEFSKPYIERLMQLGTYTYSLIAECLEASYRVASFTADDVAKLNEDELAHYHEVKSLKSVVANTFAALDQKVFDTADPNSVASHLKSFNDINDRIFIRKGTVNIPLKSSVWIDHDEHCKGSPYDGYDVIDPKNAASILNDFQNKSPLSFDDLHFLVSYIGSVYPGKSITDYLMMVGINDYQIESFRWRRHTLNLMTDYAGVERSDTYERAYYEAIDVHSNQLTPRKVISAFESFILANYDRPGGSDDYVMFFIADTN